MSLPTFASACSDSQYNHMVQGRDGIFLFNQNDIYIGQSLSYYGEFSHLEMRMLRQLCGEGDVVMEVGANIGSHIALQFTGLRPGEKLYEELLIDHKDTQLTEHSRILRSFEKYFSLDELRSIFERISGLTAIDQDIDWVLSQLEHYVDGYQRSSEVRVN